MNKEDILMMIRADRDYAERQVKEEIDVLRGILDRVERGLDEGDPRANDGLQGNEWRLYTQLSNLEKLNRFIKQLEELQ